MGEYITRPDKENCPACDAFSYRQHSIISRAREIVSDRWYYSEDRWKRDWLGAIDPMEKNCLGCARFNLSIKVILVNLLDKLSLVKIR